MIDIWRTINPTLKYFTWYRGNKKSRLDYFFTSDHILNIVSDIDILPGIHSDHSLLKMTINGNGKHNIGKGFWKFNTSLLHDEEYIKHIKEITANGEKQYLRLIIVVSGGRGTLD